MPVCRSSGVPLPNNAQILTNMKMYKKPIIEVTAVDTELMMQDLNVSINQGGGPGTAGMPKRGEIIP